MAAGKRDGKTIIIRREEASPDKEHSVRRYLNSIERAIVGFCWQW